MLPGKDYSSLSEYGLAIRPDSRIIDNSVGEAQRVEIIKALYRGRVLILDEPTAVLPPKRRKTCSK